jgi:hypothetical protein
MKATKASFLLLLAISLAGCEIGFMSEITPVQWPTKGHAGFGQGRLFPALRPARSLSSPHAFHLRPS